MFARVTKYKMKPGSRDTATVLLNRLKDSIMGMNGMHNFVNVMNEDGSGYVISVVESEETSDANAEQVQALWGQFAEHLEGPPATESYDVIANWAN